MALPVYPCESTKEAPWSKDSNPCPLTFTINFGDLRLAQSWRVNPEALQQRIEAQQQALRAQQEQL